MSKLNNIKLYFRSLFFTKYELQHIIDLQKDIIGNQDKTINTMKETHCVYEKIISIQELQIKQLVSNIEE